MSNTHPQPGAVPMHQPRPSRKARHIPTFQERIEQEALADFRRDQRKRRPRPSLARDFAPVLQAGPASHVNGYPCPELRRVPGVVDARFAAFALPSRVGDWLHYPDGRKERFPGK